MLEYRVDLLDRYGQIQHTFTMTFESDDEAILYVALMVHLFAAMVWESKRLVKRFKPGDLAE